MKSEQEFLAAMWTKIEALEDEAYKKIITHELNNRLFFNEILAYGVITALFIAGGLTTLLANVTPDIVYAIAVLLFISAFFAETLYFTKPQEVTVNENRNNY